MKANKTTILLVVTLLLVWGVIGYSTYKSFGVSDNQQVNIASRRTQQPTEKSDTFSLLLNYSDPFVYSPNSTNINKSIEQGPHSAKTIIPSIKDRFSGIDPTKEKLQYLGMIAGKNTSSSTVLLIVNEEELTVDRTYKPLGYSITKITPDSLCLVKGKNHLTLKRL